MDRKYVISEDGIQYRVWDVGDDNAPLHSNYVLLYEMPYWAVLVGRWVVKSGMKRKTI